MARGKKGLGSVVRIRNHYYARWKIAGKAVYGQKRDSFEEADRDRTNYRPQHDETTPTIRATAPTLQDLAFWCMDPENDRFGIYGRGLHPSTFETNESIRIRRIEGSAIGRKRIRAIDEHDIRLWLEQMKKLDRVELATGEIVYRPSAQPVSDAYRHRAFAFLSKLFTIAESHQFIQRNPCRFVKVKATAERMNYVLSSEQLAKFIPPVDRTDAVILTLATTGLRRGELVRLKWDDIREGHIVIYATATKGGNRLHPIAPAVEAILQAQPRRGIYVFTTENGTPLNPRNLTRDVKARFRERGIPAEARLQDLRGTFLTLLIQRGTDIKTVQQLGRHKNEKTTIRNYIRSSNQTQRGAVFDLTEHLGMNPPAEDSKETSGTD